MVQFRDRLWKRLIIQYIHLWNFGLKRPSSCGKFLLCVQPG